MVGKEEEAEQLVVMQFSKPEGLGYIWDLYLEIDLGRQDGGFGPAKFSECDLLAWQINWATPLSSYEIKVIRRIEKVYFEWHAKQK